jgi:hypothetical protein
MSTLEIQELENSFYDSFDEHISFERIRHHRDGRMPVGRSAAANRSSRRQEKYRSLGRSCDWRSAN